MGTNLYSSIRNFQRFLDSQNRIMNLGQRNWPVENLLSGVWLCTPLEVAISAVERYQATITQSQWALPITKFDTIPPYLLNAITETLARPYQTLWDSALCALEMARPYLPETTLAEYQEIIATESKQASKKFLSYENVLSILAILCTIVIGITANKSQEKSDETQIAYQEQLIVQNEVQIENQEKLIAQNAKQIENQERIIAQNEIMDERMAQILELLQEQNDSQLQDVLKYLMYSIDYFNDEIATSDLDASIKE